MLKKRLLESFNMNSLFLNFDTKEQIIEKLRLDKINVLNLPEKWKSDRDVGLEIVKKTPYFFCELDSELLDDKEIVSIALAKTEGLANVSERLRDDDDVVWIAVNMSPNEFFFVSERLKDDRGFVLKTLELENSGKNLKYISEKLKNDREIVEKALKHKGMVLSYASNRLRNDIKIVQIAIDANFHNLSGVSKKLLLNPVVIEKALTLNGFALKYFPQSIQGSKHWVALAIKQNIFALQHASEELQCDKGFLETLRESEENVSFADRAWFSERMQKLCELEVLEDEDWMKENRPKAPLEHQTRKF